MFILLHDIITQIIIITVHIIIAHMIDMTRVEAVAAVEATIIIIAHAIDMTRVAAALLLHRLIGVMMATTTPPTRRLLIKRSHLPRQQ